MKRHALGVRQFLCDPVRGVLLVRTELDSRHAGLLQLPGGKTDHGETVFSALDREVLEETGLHAPTRHFYLFLIEELPDAFSGGRHRTWFFGEGEPPSPEDNNGGRRGEHETLWLETAQALVPDGRIEAVSAVALHERARVLRETNGNGCTPPVLTVIVMQGGEVVERFEAGMVKAMARSAAL